MMLHYALQAADCCAGEGIGAEVIALRTLSPPDRATIVASVRKTGKALIVHEDNLTGGYGAEIAAILADEAFTDLDAPVRRLCGPDIPAVPFSHPLQDWFMPNPNKIAPEVPSPASGTVLKVYGPEGQTVRAGTLLAMIGQPGEVALDSGPEAASAGHVAAEPSPAPTGRGGAPARD